MGSCHLWVSNAFCCRVRVRGQQRAAALMNMAPQKAEGMLQALNGVLFSAVCLESC